MQEEIEARLTFILQQLAQARSNLGISQKEAGEMICKTQSAYSKIESAAVEITLKDFLTLASAFKMNMAVFFTPLRTNEDSPRQKT